MKAFSFPVSVSMFALNADNEHIYLDLEEKLTKYFPKEWKQESGKVRPVNCDVAFHYTRAKCTRIY